MSPAVRRVVLLVVLAFAARAVAAVLGPVSDDLKAWRWVAQVVQDGGDPYATGRLNWPPLWLGWIALAGGVARTSSVAFDLIVRLLPIAADAGIAVLLGRLGRGLGYVYALHPVALAVTGSQAQFDALPALCALGGAVMLTRGRPGLAGLLFGLGAGFKTWPAFCVPALALGLPAWRDRLRLLGPAFGLPLVLVIPLAVLTPAAFREHVLGYHGYAAWWGLTGLFAVAPSAATRAVSMYVAGHARLFASLGVVAGTLVGWRLPPVRACLAVILSLLAFAPGFGPQYLLWLVPLALLEKDLVARLWHVLASAALLVEFYVLPHVRPDPSLGAVAADLLVNRQVNALRFPLWLLGVCWLGLLARDAFSRSRT